MVSIIQLLWISQKTIFNAMTAKQDLSNILPFLIKVLSTSLPLVPPFLPYPSSQPFPFTFPFPQSLSLSISFNTLLLFFPPQSVTSPSPCFRGCLVYDEVHILRDSGSHLHFPLSPPFGVSVLLMRAQGPQKGERDTDREREEEESEEEGLERDREVAHGLPAAVNTQVGVGKREEVCHCVIYYTSFIRQQTKGQGTLRWALANDGKCKQS